MELPTIKNKGTVIFPGARLSNGSQVLKETLNTNLMEGTLGVHSVREFNNKVYVYIDNEIKDIQTKEQMDELGSYYTFYLLREVQAFINRLWEVKDNNIYVRDGFLLSYDKNFEDGYTYKASVSAINSFSDCRKVNSIFSDEEIEKAIQSFEPSSFEDYDEELGGGKYVTSDHFYIKKGSNRMLRARYFTLAARDSAIAPMKILHYCNALECLFTVGTAEISHKIAERVAVMLATTAEDKRLIFELVKSAYKYRSKLVHGQHLTKTEEALALADISRELDSILRQLIVTNHEIFDKDDTRIESFFTDLVFKTPTVGSQT
jgi:hypothetical protein